MPPWSIPFLVLIFFVEKLIQAIHRAFTRTSKSKNSFKLQRIKAKESYYTRSPQYHDKEVSKRNKRYVVYKVGLDYH